MTFTTMVHYRAASMAQAMHSFHLNTQCATWMVRQAMSRNRHRSNGTTIDRRPLVATKR